MAEIVNLRLVRKRKARAEASSDADANRVKFGRARSERNAMTAERARLDRRLDGHQLEPDDHD